MNEYHKINTIWKRESAKPCRIIPGSYSTPEFEYLANNSWVFTEKVDGTNIRVMFDDHNANDMTFGGKTDNANIPARLVKKLQELFPYDKVRSVFTTRADSGVCLYGEGCGANIQAGSGKYGAEPDFVLFDVKVGSWWLLRQDVEDVAAKLGIKVAPVIGEGTMIHACTLVQTGLTSQWGNFEAEGIVLRPRVDLWSRKGERIIAKIKTRDYTQLLKAA